MLSTVFSEMTKVQSLLETTGLPFEVKHNIIEVDGTPILLLVSGTKTKWFIPYVAQDRWPDLGRIDHFEHIHLYSTVAKILSEIM